MERDIYICLFGKNTYNFNSHAHVERDSWLMVYVCYILNFNSHAHVERDDTIIYICVFDKISTHTLTWSVTLGYYMLYYRYSNFNSHAHVERDIVNKLNN